jgi:hypothetical protein
MEHMQATATSAAERYLLDEMPADEREDFEQHFFDCAECAADVRDEAIIRGAVRADRAHQQAANNVISFRPSRASWLAAAAALSGMAFLGYQNVAMRRDVADARQARVVRSYTAVGLTRGAEPTVIEHSGEWFEIVLSVESGTRYRVRIVGADDRDVTPPRETPAAGLFVAVVVPRRLLQPGNYTVVADPLPDHGRQSGKIEAPVVVRSY